MVFIHMFLQHGLCKKDSFRADFTEQRSFNHVMLQSQMFLHGKSTRDSFLAIITGRLAMTLIHMSLEQGFVCIIFATRLTQMSLVFVMKAFDMKSQIGLVYENLATIFARVLLSSVS